MDITNILTLAGGLALFLLGMDSMGKGLETACGNKMKSILNKLTSNRFIGVLVGALITAVIQSSSATTVMVVGFVNAGMMTLSQAIWIIMGANIGTTITGLLIAMDVGLIAPIIAVVGVVLMLFFKKPLVNEIGKILAGFGILFIGMDMMSGAMSPLRDSEVFTNLMTQFSNPILGILAGMVFTAIIQSSSASIGILQALAMAGTIKLDSAVFVLFGMNIGTCITALLAALSGNRNAKRTTLIHFMFNIIGTILFTVICLLTPFTDLMEKWFNEPELQIASVHTIFNITTTIILIPFGLYLVKLAEKILPDKKVEEEKIFMYLDNDIDLKIGGATVHIENVKRETERMYDLAIKNLELSFLDILNKNSENRKEINKTEDLIDKLNEGIIKNITVYLHNETNYKISEIYGAYIKIATNIERIADHAVNLSDENEDVLNRDLKFSDAVEEEIAKIYEVLKQMQAITLDINKFEEVKKLEQLIDDLTKEYRDEMVERIKISKCTSEGSISYSTLLINFERIGDHFLNIAELIQKI